MRIFFSVGEPSGDLHASNLIRHLHSQNPDIECVGYGGPKMEAAGCKLQFDLTQLAVMFIWEALKKFGQFRQLANDAETYFRQNKVDAVVLIDYPGFNWWIAKRAKKHGIPVFFYGVPQMWAWGSWRIKKIRKWVDHVLCKLPFEANWFAKRNCHATYVGHPFFDQLHGQSFDENFIEQCKNPDEKLLTLLPGSRRQEVENHLPMLLDAARIVYRNVDNLKVAIACYNDQQFSLAQQILADHPIDADLYFDRTPELMKSADVCLACSGSVSLELLYHRKPTVIVYKPSRLLMFLRPFMFHSKYITLVNLIGESDVQRTEKGVYNPDAPGAVQVAMPEYLTTVDRSMDVARRAITWLNDPVTAAQKRNELEALAEKFALPGATERAADYILSVLAPLSYHQISPNEVRLFSNQLLDQVAESHLVESENHGRAA